MLTIHPDAPAASLVAANNMETGRSRHRRTLSYSSLRRSLTGVVTASFAIMLVAGQFFAPAHSDSVAQQNILRSVLAGESRDVVVPQDTWFLHLPIYFLTGLLPAGPTTHLFDVLLTNAVMLVGLLVFTRTYLQRLFPQSRLALVVAHLVAAWFLGLAVYAPHTGPVGGVLNNSVATGVFLTPNHRNLETGIALLLLAWFAWWADRPAPRALLRRMGIWLAASLALGTLYYSDPFFLYTSAGALAVTCGSFWLSGRWTGHRTAGTLSILAGAGATLVVLSASMRILGVHVVTATQSTFAPVDALGENVQNVFAAYLAMFRAYVWGLPIGAPGGLVALNAALAVSVTAGLTIAFRAQLRAADPVRLPALLFIVIAVGAYACSTLAENPQLFRYIFVPVVAAAPFATDFIMRLARLGHRWRRLVVVILCVGLLANVTVNLSTAIRQIPLGTSRMYVSNEALIQAVESAGYKKGYASYWNANINTYLSGRGVLFLPILYDGATLRKYDFLINTPDFDVSAGPTFVYVSPADSAAATATSLTIENVVHAVGTPMVTETLPTGGTLLFYSRDIGSGLQRLIPAVGN